MAKQKWTNGDLQDTAQTTNDRPTHIPAIQWMNSCAPENEADPASLVASDKQRQKKQ